MRASQRPLPRVVQRQRRWCSQLDPGGCGETEGIAEILAARLNADTMSVAADRERLALDVDTGLDGGGYEGVACIVVGAFALDDIRANQ